MELESHYTNQTLFVSCTGLVVSHFGFKGGSVAMQLIADFPGHCLPFTFNLNRAHSENTNFKTFVPRNLKFHTFVDLHTVRNAENFNLIS